MYSFEENELKTKLSKMKEKSTHPEENYKILKECLEKRGIIIDKLKAGYKVLLKDYIESRNMINTLEI
jgi:hypothetical protein